MKQSVGWPRRLASAQSVRAPLRRNASGIAENIFVSISRGGTSRYIIAWFHLMNDEGTINEHVRAVDVIPRWGGLRKKPDALTRQRAMNPEGTHPRGYRRTRRPKKHRRQRRIAGRITHGSFRPDPAFPIAGNTRRERTRSHRISRARRAAVEEICRHHHRSQPDQGPARRAAAETRLRIYRPHRYQGWIRSHSGAAP